MLALGVPNKYGAKRIGHSGEDMLQRVYQHTITEREKTYAEQINAYFDKLL